MGTFQLSSDAQDFAMLSAQLQPPGVVVMIKGRGMKGVQGADINQTKIITGVYGRHAAYKLLPHRRQSRLQKEIDLDHARTLSSAKTLLESGGYGPLSLVFLS